MSPVQAMPSGPLATDPQNSPPSITTTLLYLRVPLGPTCPLSHHRATNNHVSALLARPKPSTCIRQISSITILGTGRSGNDALLGARGSDARTPVDGHAAPFVLHGRSEFPSHAVFSSSTGTANSAARLWLLSTEAMSRTKHCGDRGPEGGEPGCIWNPADHA